MTFNFHFFFVHCLLVGHCSIYCNYVTQCCCCDFLSYDLSNEFYSSLCFTGVSRQSCSVSGLFCTTFYFFANALRIAAIYIQLLWFIPSKNCDADKNSSEQNPNNKFYRMRKYSVRRVLTGFINFYLSAKIVYSVYPSNINNNWKMKSISFALVRWQIELFS